MDDLMKCLYSFAISRRLGTLWDDPEYKETSHTMEEMENRLKKNLNEEQRKQLLALMDSVSACQSVEQEHLFQAALRLSRELNDLVRA